MTRVHVQIQRAKGYETQAYDSEHQDPEQARVQLLQHLQGMELRPVRVLAVVRGRAA